MLASSLLDTQDIGGALAGVLQQMGVGEIEDNQWLATPENLSEILFNSSIEIFTKSTPPLIRVHKKHDKEYIDIYAAMHSIILDNLIGDGVYNLDRLHATTKSPYFIEDHWPRVPAHISRLEMMQV